MGGTGSTRWNNHEAKPLVEAALRLDLARPELRDALDQPHAASGTLIIRTAIGAWTWSLRIGAVQPDGTRRLVLDDEPDDPHVDGQVIELVPVQVGIRTATMAVCPGCERRVRVVHALPADGRWACRQCLGLAYSSSRSDARVRRVARALRRGDDAVLAEYDAKMAKGGSTGLAALRVVFDAMERAFGPIARTRASGTGEGRRTEERDPEPQQPPLRKMPNDASQPLQP